MSAASVNAVAIVACVPLASAATVLVRTFARRLTAVKPPHRFVMAHDTPIPSLGGLAICLAAGAGVVIAGLTPPAWIVVGVALFLASGVIDDVLDLSVPTKFLLQLACAIVPALMGSGWHPTGSGPLDSAMTVLWILLVVNAVNLTDVCDGLVAGLTIVSLAGIALMDPVVTPLCLLLAAACVGFLPFNLPTATIFLGESGTASLGFLLASLSLGVAAQASPPAGVVAMGFSVAVPLFELVFLVVVRNRKGLHWWHESADHVALRLQAAGNSAWRTDALMWLVAGAMALAGYSLLVSRWQSRILVGLLVIAAIVLCWILLAKSAPAAPAAERL